ncbi:hypothetical protein CITFRE_30950 [Citrobacter freundii]|nr:hypothetical protein CITFRE_30950 [Citrobacter freundii]
MLKEKIISILEVFIYIVLAYWLTDTFFAFNKYSWMLELDDSICSIPVVSNDNRSLQAAVAAFFCLHRLSLSSSENSMSEECLISGYLVSR